MNESLEILKMRALLSFLNEDSRFCTVTGLSSVLGESKQKISRLLMSLEKDGLLDRTDLRHPKLTDDGIKSAEYYEDRTSVILNHLLYEGLDIESAEHDSYAWALYSSENVMEIIRSSEQRYRAKYELRRQNQFGGDELCKHLSDGEYLFPFLIYKENLSNGTNLSMANSGFEHPCKLVVADGKGTIVLKPLDITAKSQMNGKDMYGRVRKLMYFDGTDFVQASDTDGCITFPSDSMFFLNIGSGMGQILHGSVCLRMQCSVGTNHMPESTAIFTIMI